MILKAELKHKEAIIQLLIESELPYEDISLSQQHFFIKEENNKLIAICAIERYNNYGLLRSLAVVDSYRNKGIGHSIYNEVLQHCKAEGISSLFLLTTTASHFFTQMGWIEIARVAAPNDIKQSTEFKSICPENAVCMMLILKGTITNKAFETYKLGFNCAQAVLTSFAQENNLPEELALKMASGLAAGIGFKGGICGAVLGAYLSLGLKYGHEQVDDDLAKEATILKMRQFDKLFTHQHNSTYCRDLLKGDVSKVDELDEIIKKRYFEKACPVFVHTAVNTLENLM